MKNSKRSSTQRKLSTIKSKLAFDRKIREFSLTLNTSEQNLARQIAHLVLGQVLAKHGLISQLQGLFKGATTMVWRLPVEQARTTKDLDVATSLSREEVAELLSRIDGDRWGEITIGRPKILADKTKTQAKPYERLLDVRVPLFYGKSEWITVILEILPLTALHLEPKQPPVPVVFQEVFHQLGLPQPTALPMISISRQLAEKLHALTAIGSERGTDLYDICVLARETDLDFEQLATDLLEVFNERAGHQWGEGFEFSPAIRATYDKQVLDLPMPLQFDQAVTEVQAIRDRINQHIKALG